MLGKAAIAFGNTAKQYLKLSGKGGSNITLLIVFSFNSVLVEEHTLVKFFNVSSKSNLFSGCGIPFL